MRRSKWTVYIVRCSDNTLYTGITTDLNHRLKQHNGTASGGARYTRSRRPVVLVYSEQTKNRSKAARREAEIKKLGKRDKELLAMKNKHGMAPGN